MHKDSSEEFNIQRELRLIEELIENGDRGHAAHHLSGLVGADPLHPRVSGLVDDLIADQESPEALADIEHNNYYGMIALNAMILFRSGQLTEALLRMLQVQAFRPGKPFIGALFSKGINSSLLQQADADQIGETISDAILHVQNLNVPEFVSLKDGLETLFRLLTTHHPQSEPLAFSESMFARRIGETARAKSAARRPDAPSYRLAVALAGAYRVDGEIDAAADAYERAVELDPDDPAARLDLGDMYLSDGRLAHARAHYRDAAAVDPGGDWAKASLAFIAVMLDDDPAQLGVLEAMAEDEADRARHLLSLTRIYERWLPDRPESILKVPFHDVTRVAISSLEAPTAIRIARLLNPSLTVTIGDIPTPDPRAPREAVRFALWTYPKNGATAEPNLHPPAPSVSERVADLAERRYDLTRWFDIARATASQLGPDAAPDLLAAMVHPPDARGDFDLEDWIFRTQIAAALVIARLDTGFDGSIRREALHSLVQGPVDWTSTAGVIALCQIALLEPEHCEPIVELLLGILRAVDSPIDFMCLSEPIVHNLLRIPNLPPEVRKGLVDYRNDNLVSDYF